MSRMNPVSMLNGMRNPKQFAMQQFQQNPYFQQAQQMTRGKNPQQIQQICQNICNQKGIDINQAFTQFKSQIGF